MSSASHLRASTDWQSWGRVHKGDQLIAAPAYRADVEPATKALLQERETVLAAGLARSYGDSGINIGGALLDMSGVDHLMAFDPQRSVLRAEAGASLWDILDFAVPRGLFLPTTPGTRYVTLGGAIANDVHGKNHHSAGSLGCHIERVALLRSDRGLIEISPDEDPELFAATIGGLGLTGVILWADLKLAPISSSRMKTETTPFSSLREFFDLAAAKEYEAEHTVAWVDCVASGDQLGRGLFTTAEWSTEHDTRHVSPAGGPNVFLDPPSFLLNRVTIGAFNSLYYQLGRAKPRHSVTPYEKFHYPLDAIGQWNRLYGAKGFFQYQSVIPPENAEDATTEMLRIIAKSGSASFLAVLKTFGKKRSPGLLSFPMEGATLALDFPNRGAKTLELFEALDKIVLSAGGRLYPAKDGRIPAEVFQAGYEAATEFSAFVDPQISSTFWQRVAPA